MTMQWERPTNIFQLTTSHRGRQGKYDGMVEKLYFNSLPHTEVD